VLDHRPSLDATRFFDRFPRFYETSQTGATSIRNNKRFQGMIEENIDLIRGLRVVDFASHDGRWTFAALEAGAAYCLGVEPQTPLVDAARETFAHYEVPRDKYDFVALDAVHYLERTDEVFDTAFMFGFITVISAQPSLFALVKRRGIKHVIIDTHITADTKPTLELTTAEVGNLWGPVADETVASNTIIAATPSRAALRLMLGHYGYDLREVDWSKYLVDGSDQVEDYAEQRRGTFIASLQSA
jgi:hypothetical protein